MDWINVISLFLTGIGTCFLAGVAFCGLNKYQDNQIFKNKLQIARKTIYAFNQIKSDIEQIRSPAVYEGEVNRLNNLPDNNALIKKIKESNENIKNSAGIAYLRINDRFSSLAELNKVEPEFLLFFEESSKEYFSNIRDAFQEIKFTSLKVIRSGEFGEKEEKVIWPNSGINGQDDDISKKVNDAVDKITRICQNALNCTAKYKN